MKGDGRAATLGLPRSARCLAARRDDRGARAGPRRLRGALLARRPARAAGRSVALAEERSAPWRAAHLSLPPEAQPGSARARAARGTICGLVADRRGAQRLPGAPSAALARGDLRAVAALRAHQLLAQRRQAAQAAPVLGLV